MTARRTAVATSLLALLAAGPAAAIDPADQVPPPQLVEGRRLLISDTAGQPDERRLYANLQDAIVSPAPGSTADPTLHGGFAVLTNRATGERDFFLLPAAGWRGLGRPAGSRGWLYRDSQRQNGPCTRVQVRPDARVTLSCRGADVRLSLDEPSQGTLTLGLGLGPVLTHCAEFGGTVRRDTSTTLSRGGRGRFQARDAPAVASCPFFPMYLRFPDWSGVPLLALLVEGEQADAPILGRLGALNIHTVQDPVADVLYTAGVFPLLADSGATLLYVAQDATFGDTTQGPDEWVQQVLAMPFYAGAQGFLGMLSRPEFAPLLPLKEGQVGDTAHFAHQLCLHDCVSLGTGGLLPPRISGRLLAIHYSLDRAFIETGVPLLVAEAVATPGVALGWAGRVVSNIHTIFADGTALPANTPFSGDGTLVYVLDPGVDPADVLALPELAAFVGATTEHVVALFE